MSVFQVTLHGEELKLFLGAQIGGAKVVAIKDVSPKFISANDLSKQLNISVDVIRERCQHLNQGTAGKHMYDPDLAAQALKSQPVRRGRKRAN